MKETELNPKVSVTEICRFFGFSMPTWKNLIADGVVAKQRNYHLSDVAMQIYRNKTKQHNTESTKRLRADEKVAKLQTELAILKDRSSRAPNVPTKKSKDSDEPVEFDLRYATKDQLDEELIRKRISKMEMDESIRRKEFIPIDLLQQVVGDLATTTSNTIDPILPLIKRNVPELPASTFDRLAKDIARLRNELADYKVGKASSRAVDDYEPKGYVDD